ncbi:MAG: SDR family NAD(P)-dependent oxidoreductase [Solirubrobacterales bacterium]|nr:SDR family NAD(P)-dependent oxidoreductase [Solirubrobacterales bacterium]
MRPERELSFTNEDLELFAAASGDRNPLHLDPEFAAGTAFGTTIAHGALSAVAMLGALPEQALSQVRSLRISFSGALLRGSGARISAAALEREPDAWEVRLSARGKTLARLLARACVEPLDPPECSSSAPMRTVPAQPSASDLQAGHTFGGEYVTGAELDALARRFDVGALDRRLLEGLAWASYVVGMELPGLYSLLAGITLTVAEGSERGEPGHALLVRDHDARTGQLTIDGALSTASGRVLTRIHCFALARAESPEPALLGIGSAPQRDRGAVLVAGASRGFGACLTLALLALGYEVHGAYASSPRRAEELARLAGEHAERLHLARVDLRDPDGMTSLAEAVQARGAPLQGLVLNAAPPPLPMGLTAQSATELADYVDTSLRLVAVPLGAMLALLEEQRGWVLFCSSEALRAPPRDWPQYVSAKAALEGLAGWLASTRPRLRTVIVRPPKMRTAMSATPSGRIGAASPEEIARWTAEQLAGDGLRAGLSMLEPPTLEVAPA